MIMQGHSSLNAAISANACTNATQLSSTALTEYHKLHIHLSDLDS
jgi:hypothetical protein